MFSLLVHLYEFAEVYTVILVWITVPLSFGALFLFYQKHYGMFVPSDSKASSLKGVSANGANR